MSNRSTLDAIPNVLTCARIALVPVVAAVVLADPGGWQVAVAVFAVAAVSDALDGNIARARGCVSRFGTVMDPVADKLLIGAALVALCAVGRAHPLLVAAIIGRELAVSALRLHAGGNGLLIGASPLGKVKMAAQVALVVALMAAGPDPLWVQSLVYVTVAVTLASGLEYAAAYRRWLRPPRSSAQPAARLTAAP
jgi:CDP-diacylglycerol---glycerol-3-phosphate 3-phosphatidyltransferase